MCRQPLVSTTSTGAVEYPASRPSSALICRTHSSAGGVSAAGGEHEQSPDSGSNMSVAADFIFGLIIVASLTFDPVLTVIKSS